MPFVAGVSIITLETGSPVTVYIQPITIEGDGKAIASLDSGNTFIQPILDASDLSSTFSAIATALPEDTVQTMFSISSHIPDSARKPISRAVHKVRVFRYAWLAESIQLVHRQLHTEQGIPARNELFIELTPGHAFARLEHADVEEDFRSSDVVKEVSVVLPEPPVGDDLIAALVDPILVELQTSPTPSGSDVKTIVITGGDDAFLTALSEKIKTTFIGGEIIFLPSHYAKYAANRALIRYQDTNSGPWIAANFVPLRVGIAKADGFVLTALRRNSVMFQEKVLLLTTSMDNQTTVTIKIVVGISPVSKDNIPIAELVLKDLKSRPRGETIIKVSFSVEDFGKTTITAEELREDGTGGGARASIELDDTMGNDLSSEDLQDILEGDASLSGNPAATEAEDHWAGERAQGDLPQSYNFVPSSS